MRMQQRFKRMRMRWCRRVESLLRVVDSRVAPQADRAPGAVIPGKAGTPAVRLSVAMSFARHSSESWNPS
jgi:hypothetical protein